MKLVCYSIKNIIDNINKGKDFVIIKYTPIVHSIIVILEKDFGLIKKNILIDKWIFIKLNKIKVKKKLYLDIFSTKNKRSFYSYKRLKCLKHKYLIIHTIKGIFSLKQALRYKQGGVLFCLIR